MGLSNNQLLIFAALLPWRQLSIKFVVKVQEFIDNVGRNVIKYFAHNDDMIIIIIIIIIIIKTLQ